MNGAGCKRWLTPSRLPPLTKPRANHGTSLEFSLSLFSVNMKESVPAATSNVAPYQATASPRARPPPHIKPPADKSSSRWHNETLGSFQRRVKCDILCRLVSSVHTAAWEQAAVARGQHQSPAQFLRSTVAHTHAHTSPPPAASSGLFSWGRACRPQHWLITQSSWLRLGRPRSTAVAALGKWKLKIIFLVFLLFMHILF